MGRLSHAELLLRDARRRRLGLQATRLVPSKRGLLTAFLAAAAAGAGAGVVLFHFFGPMCR